MRRSLGNCSGKGAAEVADPACVNSCDVNFTCEEAVMVTVPPHALLIPPEMPTAIFPLTCRS